jgi:hypothetical protein
MTESLVTSVSPLWQSKLYRITSGYILCNAAAHVIPLATLVEQEHTSENWTMRKGNLLAGQMTRTCYGHSSILGMYRVPEMDRGASEHNMKLQNFRPSMHVTCPTPFNLLL